MELIYFKNDGGPLKVEFIVKNGVVAASYDITLFEVNSNKKVINFEGNNQNTMQDIYQLPNPENSNDGRILRLIVDFIGLDVSISKDYIFNVNFYQAENATGSIQATGSITGASQSALLFGQLKMQ